MVDESHGARILVPRSRAGSNVLADALRAKGADVVEFPALDVEPPSDLAALDAAVHDVRRFAWVLFSGAHSVLTFLSRLEASGSDAPDDRGGRIVALGTGTVGALRAHGIRPAFAPREHFPEAVLDVMGRIAGERVLLLREETAERALPDALRRAGAEVSDVAGYRLEVRVDDAVIRAAFDPRPTVVALPNPTSARVLRRALSAAGAAASVDGIPVWAVGPTTAEAAKRYGFEVAHVSGGRLQHLVRDLVP